MSVEQKLYYDLERRQHGMVRAERLAGRQIRVTVEPPGGGRRMSMTVSEDAWRTLVDTALRTGI